MIPVWLRMTETALLSCLAVILFIKNRTEPRRDCMTAMLLSSAGDVLIVNSQKIGQFATFVGAGVFIAAHILYGECFRRQIKEKNVKAVSPAFFAGTAVMLISAVIIGILTFTLPEEKKPVMFVLILVYIAAIGYNVCMNYSYAKITGGVRMLLPIAVTAFYLTDIFIFCDMLNIDHVLRQYVWYIYPVSQLIIVLLCCPLRKSES